MIPHVADDQLIETGWGNAVADAVNANTDRKVPTVKSNAVTAGTVAAGGSLLVGRFVATQPGIHLMMHAVLAVSGNPVTGRLYFTKASTPTAAVLIMSGRGAVQGGNAISHMSGVCLFPAVNVGESLSAFLMNDGAASFDCYADPTNNTGWTMFGLA